MNKLELVDHVAKATDLPKDKAAEALEAVLNSIEKTLKRGEEVRLVGFGTLRPKRAPKGAQGAKVRGVTKEGVRILESKTRAKHFSAKEIREAVTAVRAKKA